mmetsp:Transcript_109/g.102  ORF Transcript_109/g.102 Transcript_109/m.102 type:complete len:215 (+) Transcript_109:143-787(+)
MLAPRKKLWSTPLEVIEESIKQLNITDRDIVYDIGYNDQKYIYDVLLFVYSSLLNHLLMFDLSFLMLNVSCSNTFSAGDGRFLIRCSQLCQARCIGIEIDDERAGTAKKNCEESEVAHLCDIICGNALDQSYADGTVFFLYLVPRGLRLIIPILQDIPHFIRVITYMSPLPEPFCPVRTLKVSTSNHEGAEWPIYLYHLNQMKESNHTNEKTLI